MTAPLLFGLLLLSLRAASSGEEPRAPDAREMAQRLGVEPLVDEAGARGSGAATARADLMRRVLQVSFEVDSAIADLQEEQTALAELTSALQGSRDARIGVLNVAAGILGAGAAVGTGMTLNDKTTTAGIWVTTITSGIGALLTIYAAVAPNRGAPPLRTQSNLLAPFFDRPSAGARYPRVVWSYLADAAPGAARSRRQSLVAQWTRLGLVAPGGGAEAEQRIEALCRPITQGADVDVDLLRDRSLMLGDVRAVVASMKVGLRALLEAVQDGAARADGGPGPALAR